MAKNLFFFSSLSPFRDTRVREYMTYNTLFTTSTDLFALPRCQIFIFILRSLPLFQVPAHIDDFTNLPRDTSIHDLISQANHSPRTFLQLQSIPYINSDKRPSRENISGRASGWCPSFMRTCHVPLPPFANSKSPHDITAAIRDSLPEEPGMRASAGVSFSPKPIRFEYLA